MSHSRLMDRVDAWRCPVSVSSTKFLTYNPGREWSGPCQAPSAQDSGASLFTGAGGPDVEVPGTGKLFWPVRNGPPRLESTCWWCPGRSILREPVLSGIFVSPGKTQKTRESTTRLCDTRSSAYAWHPFLHPWRGGIFLSTRSIIV